MNKVVQSWIENQYAFPELTAMEWLEFIVDNEEIPDDWTFGEVREAVQSFKHPVFGKRLDTYTPLQ